MIPRKHIVILLIGLLSTSGWAEEEAPETKPEAEPDDKSHEWSYDDQSAWPSTCIGQSQQSPINIDTTAVYPNRSLSLHLLDYDEYSYGWTAENDGHSAKFSFVGRGRFAPTPYLTGSVVGDRIYRFAQFHSHWGDGQKRGSEHTIDDYAYPMETHFVHYNTDYANFSEALGKPDGVVVLGVFHRFRSNPRMADIVHTVSELDDAPTGQPYPLNYPIRLNNLLPANTAKFYTYPGSLTTPPCTQNVTWIVLDHHSFIGYRQLRVFRKLQKYNFRDVQPLDGRVVQASFDPRGWLPAPPNTDAYDGDDYGPQEGSYDEQEYPYY